VTNTRPYLPDSKRFIGLVPGGEVGHVGALGDARVDVFLVVFAAGRHLDPGVVVSIGRY